MPFGRRAYLSRLQTLLLFFFKSSMAQLKRSCQYWKSCIEEILWKNSIVFARPWKSVSKTQGSQPGQLHILRPTRHFEASHTYWTSIRCKIRQRIGFWHLLEYYHFWTKKIHLIQLVQRKNSRGTLVLEVHTYWWIQGGARECAPFGSKFFHFHAIFEKKFRLAHQLWELAPPPGNILDPLLTPIISVKELLQNGRLWNAFNILESHLTGSSWIELIHLIERVYFHKRKNTLDCWNSSNT